MEFVNTNGTVARSLGRSANLPYVCIGLDVEDADIVLANTHTVEAFQFMARHAVSCFYFLSETSNPNSYTPLKFNSDVFRHRGVTKPFNSVRSVVCKNITFTGNPVPSLVHALGFLNFCTTLGTSFALLNVDQQISKLEFDFGSAINITGFAGTIAPGHVSIVTTLKMYLNDVEVYSGAPASLTTVVADRAELLFYSPSATVYSSTLTNIRFLSTSHVEYEEEVKSIMLARLDFTQNRPWSQQIPLAHYRLDEVVLPSNVTGLLRTTFPLTIGMEARNEV